MLYRNGVIMNIDFKGVVTNHANFIEYVCAQNMDALRSWKNLGPVSPQKIYRDAFHIAVRDNLLDAMAYLLERPHFYNTEMYNSAVATVCLFTQSQDMFNMLYPLSNIQEVQRILIEEGGHEHWTVLQHRREQMESERLHTRIYNAVGSDRTPSHRVLKI